MFLTPAAANVKHVIIEFLWKGDYFSTDGQALEALQWVEDMGNAMRIIVKESDCWKMAYACLYTWTGNRENVVPILDILTNVVVKAHGAWCLEMSVK